MWVRSELKERAKWVLKQCYWKAVLVSLILAVITGNVSGSSGGNYRQGQKFKNEIIENGGAEYLILFLTTIAVFILAAAIIGIVVGVFIFNPLEVSIRRFFVISRVQPAELNELGFCFKNSYMNIVKVQFLRSLFNFLWYLLLIVPGIIKCYEYRMIPYILAENPEMDSSEVFRLSKDMMYGEKWNAFVLDLSFLGWNILSLFTCGILSIFYVNPYQNLTNVELYDVLKNKLFSSANEQNAR
ncbi:MAG: DUF975 family protein [Clostridiales bacterium]|mgnify:CR=1 FL=1|nr:DUF975 family protein [Clostridiales bacterium]